MFDDLKRQVRQFFYWGWKLRNNNSWDMVHLYEIIEFKADQVYKSCMKYGHTSWTEPNSNLAKKLLEVKGLARKLGYETDMRYNKRLLKVIENYGYKKRSSAELLFFPDKETKIIDKKLYSFYFKKASEMDRKIYETDKKRLFYLLDKYLEHWWD